MSSTQAHTQPLQFLTTELRTSVIDQSELVLLKIVRANLSTQYASKAPLLARFRDALSACGSHSDTELVHNFRRSVPLSDYDAYRPFMTAFNASPCKEAELEDLFAPGLPYFLAVSSSTSGREPKLFPKYISSAPPMLFGEGPVSAVYFLGYRNLKYVEREHGQIVKKIMVTSLTAGVRRAMLGWGNVDEDEDRMSVIAPGLIAPFAASMIAHHKSFLMIHALFTLACRDTDRFITPISTLFYDLVRCVDEEWNLFLSSIKNGTVPDLPGVHKVHPHLQVNFHANPQRAAELREIGPPFSREGWAARVWPKLKNVTFACSGSFASVLPKVQLVVGPTIVIHNAGYGSSESLIGLPYRPDDPHTFVLPNKNLIEFLDVTAEESHESLRQTWEVEVGKQYEVVLTTTDGLWRYRLGDIIEVVGFDPNSGSPVFMLSGRSLSIRLAPVLISDADLISAIQSIGPDVIQVYEYTTWLDDRQSPPTVGYLIERGAPGPSTHLVSQKLSDGLAAVNTKYQMALQDAKVRIPSVRILSPGTFAAFRQWKAEKMNIGPGQVKVPVVLMDEASRRWMLERVVGEL